MELGVEDRSTPRPMLLTTVPCHLLLVPSCEFQMGQSSSLRCSYRGGDLEYWTGTTEVMLPDSRLGGPERDTESQGKLST